LILFAKKDKFKCRLKLIENLIKKIKEKISWVKVQGFLTKYFWCFLII